ncbi:hypothetical protein ACE1SV_68780 [Streptomyces sp. E-15]
MRLRQQFGVAQHRPHQVAVGFQDRRETGRGGQDDVQAGVGAPEFRQRSAVGGPRRSGVLRPRRVPQGVAQAGVRHVGEVRRVVGQPGGDGRIVHRLVDQPGVRRQAVGEFGDVGEDVDQPRVASEDVQQAGVPRDRRQQPRRLDQEGRLVGVELEGGTQCAVAEESGVVDRGGGLGACVGVQGARQRPLVGERPRAVRGTGP